MIEPPQQRQVSLPEHLCSAAEEVYCRAPGTRFPSLEKLIAFLLEEISRQDGAALDQQERRMIEERLKALGYM
jgi:hypothetical protein